MAPMSDAKKKANKKWNDANMKERYDRVQLVLPKGRKAELQTAAERHGQSVNGFISSLIDEALKHELAGVLHDDLPACGTGAEDGQRGAGGGDDDAGTVSIFLDGEAAPCAPVGISPMPDEKSSPAE